MRIQIFLILALSLSQVLSRDYDDEEGRPYEFGFTIDGQQHRRESKDVNGIIMGEFGFITADGIYHVTVYATDENGNFKILSMRNVRVSGPLDQPGYEFKKSEKLQQAPPSTTTTTTTTTQAPTTNFKAPYSFTTLPSLNVAACSSCRLPSTTPRPPGAPNKLPFQTPAFQDKKPVVSNIPAVVSNKPSVGVPNYPSVASPFGLNNPPVLSPNVPVVPQNIPPNIPYNLPPDVELIAQNPSAGKEPEFDDLGAGVLQPRFEPKLPISTPSIEQQPPFQNPGNNLIPTHEELQSPVNPEIQNFVPDQTPRPTNINIPKTPQITVANSQINIPGKDPIPIKDTYPNMVDGLPEGITENDMLDLLYKFNYTLGFHGHHERGLKNGAKIGAYFVNGRDGIMRIVEYVADENGYRPKVKFINLGLDSPDTPKEGSEKKFGLKGFEFVWYPV